MDDALNDAPLRGRRALITGAGRSVGLGIARALAATGATVLVNDLDAERAEQAAEQIRSDGGDAQACPFDVTADAVVRELIPGLDVDILVHNAGVLPGGGRPNKFVDMPAEDWMLQLELNLIAMMRLAQLVLPGQLARGWGRIIQISSGASSRGLPIGVAAYGAAKAGAEGLIRHLAVENAPGGVTANSLALGLMENLGRVDDPAVGKLIRAVPIGRLGRPDEVGAAVVWLASGAGELVNGQVIHLNGGTVFGK